METIDEYVTRVLPGLRTAPSPAAGEAETLCALFTAQVQSRHLDLAARWLQSPGRGYYTIGSAPTAQSDSLMSLNQDSVT